MATSENKDSRVGVSGMLTRSRSKTLVLGRASKAARLSPVGNSPLTRSRSKKALERGGSLQGQGPLETTRVLFDALPTSDASSSDSTESQSQVQVTPSETTLALASEVATKAEVAYISGALRRPVIIWDTETTGLSPKTSDIVEIALEELGDDTNRPMLSFSSLVRPPDLPEPRARNRVHGITNAMMQDSPSFEQVWPAIEEYVSDVQARYSTVADGIAPRPILIAHNMLFDLRFLRKELERIGKPLPKWDFACSLQDVSKRVWPERKHSLAALTELADVINEDAHRALADVQATAGVLHYIDKCLGEYAATGGNSEKLPVGVCIRLMILEGARKRRKSIHGDDAVDMDMEDHMSIASTNTNTNAAALARSLSVTTNAAEVDGDDKVMEVSDAEDNPDSDSEDEEELRYHWVANGTTYHNSRDCVMLDRSLCTETTIHSEPRPPAGRKICARCRASMSGISAISAASAVSDNSPSKMSTSDTTIPEGAPASNPNGQYPIITRSRSSTSLRARKSYMDDDSDDSDDSKEVSEIGSDDDVTMKSSNTTTANKQQSWYIAPTGSLYHSDRACVNLELARTIRRIDDVPKHRYPCNRCVSGARHRSRSRTRT